MKLYTSFNTDTYERIQKLPDTMREQFRYQAIRFEMQLEDYLNTLEKDAAKDLTLSFELEQRYEMTIEVATRLFGVTQADLEGQCRKKHLCDYRKMISAVLRPGNYILEDIGMLMGGRDHSTIIHQLQSHNDLITSDSVYQKQFKHFEANYLMLLNPSAQ